MTILIQLIEVEWTKASRGAPMAALRNAVPETHPIGKHKLPEGVYYQSILYSEFSNFCHPKIEGIRSLNDFEIRNMKLQFFENDESVLVVTWGIPLRKEHGKEKIVGCLKKNTWLRIAGNARSSLESTWAYHKYVFNIFSGDSIEFDDIVQNTNPVVEYRDEVDLW